MKATQMNPEAAILKIEIAKLKNELKYCIEIFTLCEKLQKQGNTFDFSELKKRLQNSITD